MYRACPMKITPLQEPIPSNEALWRRSLVIAEMKQNGLSVRWFGLDRQICQISWKLNRWNSFPVCSSLEANRTKLSFGLWLRSNAIGFHLWADKPPRSEGILEEPGQFTSQQLRRYARAWRSDFAGNSRAAKCEAPDSRRHPAFRAIPRWLKRFHHAATAQLLTNLWGESESVTRCPPKDRRLISAWPLTPSEHYTGNWWIN